MRRVSDRARAAWWASLGLAEDCSCNGSRVGAFEHPELGAMTIVEIAEELHVPEKQMPGIVTELIDVKLWSRDADGVIWLSKFEEETTPADPRSAERVRRFRAKGKRDQGVTETASVAPDVTPCNAVTVTVEEALQKRNGNANETPPVTTVTSVTVTPQSKIESKSSSEVFTDVHTSAEITKSTDGAKEPVEIPRPAFPGEIAGPLPDDVLALKRVARHFLATFANSRSDDAQKKHGPGYTTTLAVFRSRGATAEQAWDAFTDAFVAESGKPLWGSESKKAISFLAARPSGSRQREFRGPRFEGERINEPIDESIYFTGETA